MKHNADCAYPVPTVPRPRKEREEILLRRIQQYEALFGQLGVDPSSMTLPERTEPQPTEYHGRSSGIDLANSHTKEHATDSGVEPVREYSKSQLVRRNDRSRYLDKYVGPFFSALHFLTTLKQSVDNSNRRGRLAAFKVAGT